MYMYIILYRRVWRYQMGYQKTSIDGQTIQCPEEKRQKDKQWSKKKTLHRKLNIEQHEPR
jgi:hypothetical protein